jgi:hypothetical protein
MRLEDRGMRIWRSRRLAILLFVCALVPPRSATSQVAPPVFRSATDLIMIDVQVVAGQTQEVPVLTPSQFEVRIAGPVRTIVLAEFLHRDEGPVIHRSGAPPLDADTRACIFGFERTSKRVHAHYLLGVQPIDADKARVEHPKVKLPGTGLTIPRWAWRSHAPPAAPRSERQ